MEGHPHASNYLRCCPSRVISLWEDLMTPIDDDDRVRECMHCEIRACDEDDAVREWNLLRETCDE